MNAIHHFEASLCVPFLWTIVHLLWEGAVIVALVQGIDGWLRSASPNARYLTHLLGLAILVFLLPFTFLTVRSTTIPTTITKTASRDRISVDRSQEPLPPIEGTRLDQGVTKELRPAIEDELLVRKSTIASMRYISFPILAGSIYLLGVAVMSARLVRGIMIGHRLRTTAMAVTNDRLIDFVGGHAKRLRISNPRLLVSSRIDVPMVVGILKPVLLLPMAILSAMPVDEIETILIHELAHLRRWDPFVLFLERCVETILFFHPAVWFLTRRTRQLREECCDEAVLKMGISAPTYAKALLSVAEFGLRTGGGMRGVQLAVVGERPSELLRRVSRLLNGKEATRPDVSARGFAAGVAAIALTAAVCFFGATTPAIAAKEAPTDPSSVRARELIYLLRDYVIFSRTDEWVGQVKDLVEIGKPAVPEIILELDSTKSDRTRRVMALALRAIGDKRGIPALLRSLPRCELHTSDCGIAIDDMQLFDFLFENSAYGVLFPKNHKKEKFFGHWEGDLMRSVGETVAGLEKLTGHTEGRELFPSGTKAMLKAHADRWDEWWKDHSRDFLTPDQLIKASPSARTKDLVAEAGLAKFGPLFPTGPNVWLEPARELVLYGKSHYDTPRYVDFDTGRTFSETIIRAGDSRRRFGIDAYCHAFVDLSEKEEINFVALGGDDLHAYEVKPELWDQIDKDLKSGVEIKHEPRQEDFYRFPIRESGSTFLFTTREGGKGILQVLHRDADVSDVLIARYRMFGNDRARTAPMADPEVHETKAPGAFEPVKDWMIDAPGPGSRFIFDFDTGAKMEAPKEMTYPLYIPIKQKEVFDRWVAEKKADGYFARFNSAEFKEKNLKEWQRWQDWKEQRRKNSKEDSFFGSSTRPIKNPNPYSFRMRRIQMVALPVSASGFDVISPSQLTSILDGQTPEPLGDVFIEPTNCVTYAFRTQQGARGLFQIIEVLDNKRLHMRSKILSQSK